MTRRGGPGPASELEQGMQAGREDCPIRVCRSVCRVTSVAPQPRACDGTRADVGSRIESRASRELTADGSPLSRQRVSDRPPLFAAGTIPWARRGRAKHARRIVPAERRSRKPPARIAATVAVGFRVAVRCPSRAGARLTAEPPTSKASSVPTESFRHPSRP